MGWVMSVVPGGQGTGRACAIPGAVNSMDLKCGLVRRGASQAQPAIAALAAFAVRELDIHGL